MHYVLVNDDEHKLGRSPLPYGKVRIFQKDSQDTTAFLGEDWGQFTPIDDKMRLYLGLAQDIAVKRTIDRVERTRVAGNLFHVDVVVKYEIENFKDEPVTLRVMEDLNQLANEAGRPSGGGGRGLEWIVGEATTFEKLDREETDVQRMTVMADLPARDGDKAEKVIHKLHLQFRNEW